MTREKQRTNPAHGAMDGSKRAKGSWKVVLVDNDPGFLKFMFRKLSQNGLDVTCAQDGITAIEAVITDPPHILFIDLIMPNIDGERLCAILRKMPHLDKARMVMVTAAADELPIDPDQFTVDACIAKESYGVTVNHMMEQIDLLGAHFSEEARKSAPYDQDTLRRITDELLNKNRSLITFLENTSDAVMEIHEGKIIYANPSACNLMGKTEQELISSKLGDYFSPEAKEHVEWLILPENNKRSRIGIDSTVELNGKQVLIQKLPVKEPVSSSILLIEDITLRRQIQEAEAREQRLESVDTLAREMARDFTNLLAPIIGYTELTLIDFPKDTQAGKNLSQVLFTANKAKDLVHHILNFGKQARKSRMPLFIQPVVDHLCGEKRRDLKEGISIETRIQPDCGPVEADPVQIRLVLSQLMENALEAMEDMDAGVLEIGMDVYSIQDKDPVPVADAAADSWIRLWVKDNGRGMDEHTRRRMFDPYFTTRPRGRGSGLGLFFVHNIITSHEGRVMVSSGPTEGTCVTCYLPMIENFSEMDKSEALAYEQGRGRILLVDDEEPIIKMLSEIITRMGYSVTGTTFPEQALELLKADKSRFDLVITDFSMPGMDGEELARGIKSIRPDLPIILCTGFSDLITPTRARAAGIAKIVMKPVTMTEMGRLIREVLEEQE